MIALERYPLYSGEGKKKLDTPLPLPLSSGSQANRSQSLPLHFQLNLSGFASVAYITSKAGIRYLGAGADRALIGALPALGLLNGEFACQSEPTWSWLRGDK